MKLTSACLILFILFQLSIFSQERNNIVSLSLGAGNFHIKDEHASELIFRGTGIAPTISWQNTGARNSHYAEGSFFYNNLSTSADNFHTKNFKGRFRYSFLHRADSLNLSSRPIFSYGGSLTSFYCKTDYFFDQVSFRARAIESWYLSHSFDLTLQLEYFFSERNYLGIQMFTPLISNVSRPPFSPSGNYDYDENDWIVKPLGQTVIFPRNLSINTNMIYSLNISGGFNIRFNWEFYYMKYADPENVGMYMNNFRVGISYLLIKSHE